QNVSPTEARYSSTLVWLGPTVRATELSQSFPIAQTHEPAREVVSVAEGAPVLALPPDTAPSTVVFAPEKATTVIMPTYEPELRVAVTVALVRGFAAAACHISAVPACVFARFRSRHVRPP